MELTAAQRKITFALVVFALAGLGVYLFTSTGHGTASGGAASHRQAGQGSGGQARPPARPPPSASTPVSSPTATAPASGTPDIYQWLPFTKAGLTSAASVAVRFGTAYGTFSYTEKTSAYVASMRGLIT